MKKKKMLWEYIADFAQTQTGVFPFEDLLAYVQDHKGAVDEDLLLHEAQRSEDLFENFEMKEDRFSPRRVLFEGANVRITPLLEEVEGGYLIPGHRFTPYIAKNIFPTTVQVATPDGSVLETRTVKLPVTQVLRYLMYFGEAGSKEYLLRDLSENGKTLDDEGCADPLVQVTALDCRSFFETSGFKPGDSLMLTIDDWECGACSVRVVPKVSEALDIQEVREWSDQLREAIGGVIDYYSSINSVEQMAYMLSFACEDGGVSILKNPPISLASFFNAQKDISFPTVGNLSFFWSEELGAPLEYVMQEEDFYMETDSELGDCLKELGVSMEASTVEAYMRGALADRVDDPQRVLARVIEGRELIFHSLEDQQNFNRLWQELWDEVRSEYVQNDDEFQTLRERALCINDQGLALLRRLDRQEDQPDDFMQSPGFLKLSMAGSALEAALVVLNRPELEDEDKEEFLNVLSEIVDSAEHYICTYSKDLFGVKS